MLPPIEIAYNFIVCPQKVTKLKTQRLPVAAFKCLDLHKNCLKESPLRGKFVGKIPILTVLKAVFPHICTDEHEIWHAGA